MDVVKTKLKELTFDCVQVREEEVRSGLLVIQGCRVLQNGNGVSDTSGFVQKSGEVGQNNVEIFLRRFSLLRLINIISNLH